MKLIGDDENSENLDFFINDEGICLLHCHRVTAQLLKLVVRPPKSSWIKSFQYELSNQNTDLAEGASHPPHEAG
jgi:hypothetical protein